MSNVILAEGATGGEKLAILAIAAGVIVAIAFAMLIDWWRHRNNRAYSVTAMYVGGIFVVMGLWLVAKGCYQAVLEASATFTQIALGSWMFYQGFRFWRQSQ